MRFFGKKRSLTCWSAFQMFGWVAITIFPTTSFAETYEVIRGKQFSLCREMEKNLNEFKNDPPMACERKFSSKFKEFRKPDWRLLPNDQAVQAALALERLRPDKENNPKYTPLAEKKAKAIQEAAASGKLKVWEAKFDIARSGTLQRVVMVNSGLCESWRGDGDGPFEPRIGVLVEDKFEVDRRYENILATSNADAFFYKGLPYLASWEVYPSPSGNHQQGPLKRHQYYVYVWDTFWLPPGTGASDTPGFGGSKGPICQIGYERIKK